MAVNRDDLMGMLGRVNAAAESLDLLGDTELVLNEGNKAAGRPWRLYEKKLTATGVNEPLNGNLSSLLGFGKPTAYTTLHTIAQTLEAVRRMKKVTK